MNFYSIILSMVTLLFSTSYTLGASNDSVNLHTYFCEGETEFGEFEPLIFKKYPENDWRLLSVYPVSNKLEKKLENSSFGTVCELQFERNDLRKALDDLKEKYNRMTFRSNKCITRLKELGDNNWLGQNGYILDDDEKAAK